MGIPTLIKTLTADGDSTLSFVDGTSDVVLDSTYDEYMFVFYDINPATDTAVFQFQVNATDDAGGGYDTSVITSTFFRAFHYENGSNAGISYSGGLDLANSASFQSLVEQINNDSDKSCAGTLNLFSPSSTTYQKHFYAHVNSTHTSNVNLDCYSAGYINDTTAIDEIQFKMSTGAFDGVIQLYGIS